MRKIFLGLSGILIFSLILMTMVWAQLTFKEGKWSMTVVTHMDNMPPQMAEAMKQMQNLSPEVKAAMQQQQSKMGMSGMQMSGDGQGMTMTYTQCMSNKDFIPDYAKNMKNMGEQNNCQHSHQIIGNTVNFQVTCDKDDIHMEMSGTSTYTGDTMEGHMKSHQEKAGKSIMDSTMEITGQYLGPC